MQKRFLVGYSEFQKADRPNRQIIMAEARAVMEAWFESGVTYADDWMGLEPYQLYNNAPEKLYDILEIAYGKIKSNILEWKGIPEYLRPQLLMCSPAYHLAPFGGLGERKAHFGEPIDGPAYGPVLWTEGKPPKERAELIANNWYHLQTHNIYGFISEIYASESNEWKQPKSRRQVESYLELDQILRDLNLNQINRIEYWACKLGFQYMEISSMLRALGVNRNPDAVKKSYYYHKQLLERSQKNL